MQFAKVQQENYGTAALSIPDALRVEAIECAELLQPFGATLRDATRFYAAHLKAVTGSRKVKDVVADLLAARAADGMSPRYLGNLRVRLGRFALSFGDEMIAADQCVSDRLMAAKLECRRGDTQHVPPASFGAFQLRQTPWLRS